MQYKNKTKQTITVRGEKVGPGETFDLPENLSHLIGTKINPDHVAVVTKKDKE